MGELLPYYALFYVLGLFMMALFVRLYWSRKKYDDAEKIIMIGKVNRPRLVDIKFDIDTFKFIKNNAK